MHEYDEYDEYDKYNKYDEYDNAFIPIILLETE